VALHITGLFTLRRWNASGYEKSQSGFALCAIFSTPKIFVPVKCFAFFLSGTKILRKQPERYMPFLNGIDKLCGILDNNFIN
jgi:hypothetical protein